MRVKRKKEERRRGWKISVIKYMRKPSPVLIGGPIVKYSTSLQCLQIHFLWHKQQFPKITPQYQPSRGFTLFSWPRQTNRNIVPTSHRCVHNHTLWLKLHHELANQDPKYLANTQIFVDILVQQHWQISWPCSNPYCCYNLVTKAINTGMLGFWSLLRVQCSHRSLCQADKPKEPKRGVLYSTRFRYTWSWVA